MSSMPKAPTVFTRPHSLHQSLQLQAFDARADRPYANLTWPPTKRSTSSPFAAALQLSTNSPYLLTKALKTTRRLPQVHSHSAVSFGGITPLAASSFFYSTTSFFEYATPTTLQLVANKPSSESPRGRAVLREKSLNNQVLPRVEEVQVSSPTVMTREPSKNSYKRLRRDSPPQVAPSAQRNTVTFPSSDSGTATAEPPARKRVRAGSATKSSTKQVIPELEPLPKLTAARGTEPMSFFDLFYQPLSVAPRKKKRSRRQRLYGRKFPARSFIPRLEAIDEETDNLVSPFWI